jgi:hypothetical protein
LKLHNIGYGLYFQDCNGDIEINNVDLRNLSNSGIFITGGNGKREFSNITGYDIRGNYNVYAAGGSGDITLAESRFDTAGPIYLSRSNASINISDTATKNVSGITNAIYTSGGNVVIERVNVENVLSGRGIEMYATGTGQIIDSSIKNCKSSSVGGGIALMDSGSVIISNTTIEDIEADSTGGGIYADTKVSQLNISNATIKNVKASGYGGGIACYNPGSVVISGTTIENVETTTVGAGVGGGGIYVAYTSGLTITDSTIKNAKVVSSYGGGICCRNTGNVVISGTTIENVTADAGSGLYFYNDIYSTLQGTLHLKLNNVYNGTLLNTQAAIANLVTSGAFWVGSGIQVVVVP